MQHMIHASPLLDKLKHWRQSLSFGDINLTTSQKVVLWSIGVVGTSALAVGILSRYLARKRAKPIMNPRIQRAINKRISRMRSPNGGMGSVASSGGRSSPLGFSERLSLASGSIGSGGGDAAPLSPQQLGVMGVCNFNGKHGCLKCTTVGEYSHSSNTVFFPTTKGSQRTDEQFRARKYGQHHKADSPLLKLPIDMVEDFPVADSLHLIDLGIMKRLLVGWKDGKFGKYLTKLCARDIEQLNAFLKKCQVPSEIHRAVRTLEFLAHWKASEFRTFLLYLSIVILPDVLKRDVFEHFLSLFCGVTICSTQSYFGFLPLAREMLADFVERYKYFYGSHYVTSNVHNLLHVVDEVERFGPLQTFNAYPFENKLYLIKNMLRQGNSPLSQIAKRLSEDNLERVSIKTKTHNFVQFVTLTKNVPIVHFEEFVLSSRSKDKYCLTHANEIFEICNVYVSNENEISIYGHVITNKTDIFLTPIRSSYLNMYKIEEPYRISSAVSIHTKDVKLKLFCVNHKNNLYLLPLVHTV